PARFADPGVRSHHLTNGTGSQPVSSPPLASHMGGPAVLLYDQLVGCLKRLLPGQVHPFPIIPDVHHALFEKPSLDARIDHFEDLPIIGYRRSRRVLSRLAAIETDLVLPA